METKLIVKYRRPNDRWVCPDCDAENDVGCIRCTVCGCEKNPSVNVLKAWNPEMERVYNSASARTATPSSGRAAGGYSSSGYGSSGSEGDSNNMFWIVMAVIIILVFILIVS